MYFSEAFRIQDPEQYEWFDPILERDSLLFADPFSIFSDSDESWQRSHSWIIDYFHDAFEMLAKSNLRKSHQYYKRTLTLMEFPEPKEFRLGYAGNTEGSGAGEGLAKLVVEAMAQAIRNGLENISHFEELGILVEGINSDRIGDITCNLLKPQLIKFTQQACRSLRIPTQDKELRHSSWNGLRQRWDTSKHAVPVDPASGKPILLIPKRFLGELPKINAYEFDTSLRDDLNLDISSRVRKAEIIRYARRHPDALRRWIEQQENTGPTPYDVDRDPKLLVKWQSAARRAVEEEPIEPGAINSEQELMSFVHHVIGKFRRWAEDRGGWRLFWDNNSSAVPEPNMQLLFLVALDGYCEQAGLRLDREVETGRGPVDFTFSGDRRIRVLVEMKKLTHGGFWNGLKVQTPIYMRGLEVDHAIFLAIRDSDTNPMRDRWRKLDVEAAAVRSETGLSIEVERVDILPRDPASKAKTRE